MRIFCIKHVFFENPGMIEEWALENEYEFKYIKMYSDYRFPKIENLDALIIMGGPMNIYEYEKYPFLKEEKEFIKKVIEADKYVFGICLGAQLIADVLGGKVVRNKEKEIGWHKVKKLGKNKILNGIPEEFKVMHWHGDKFLIPEGAERIFESEACENQGFLYNEKVLALQFHLEMKKENLDDIIENCGDELIKTTDYVQSKQEILHSINNLDMTNKIMSSILNKFLG